MGTQEVDLPVSPTELLLRCSDQPFVFVLDGGSAASWGTGQALLGFRPRATLQVMANGTARVYSDGVAQRWRGDPFALLERFCGAWAPPASRDPLGGGVIAALGYDLRHWVERLPRRAPDALQMPVLHAAAYDWLLSYSYAERRYRLASSSRSAAELHSLATELAARAASAPLSGPFAATERGNAESKLPSSVPGHGNREVEFRVHPAIKRCPPVMSTFTKEEYHGAIAKALEYIAAGDVYQINLAQRFMIAASDGVAPAPATLFARLQHAHPMPFAAFVDAGDFVLISNSPECFLIRRQQQVTTFPIKGTCRRDADPQIDRALGRDLAMDPKERAEHVMIVDLERNDLGRVCRIGSVRVESFAQVRAFPSLYHLVSKVTGELRRGVTLAELLRATFPGGSITGAPKVRAMAIIDEIEPVGRGFFTGAIGFIGGGDAVFNIAIRTAVACGGWLTYHAGGGIVADSNPAREYDETLLKAEPFFAALTAGAA